MTNQEIFNKVYKHLLTQNKQAVSYNLFYGQKNKLCKYRSKNLKCAIGCLIPDKLYSKNMEGLSVEELAIEYPELGFKKGNIRLLGDLQSIHDLYDPTLWKQELKDIAKEFKLKIPRIRTK